MLTTPSGIREVLKVIDADLREEVQHSREMIQDNPRNCPVWQRNVLSFSTDFLLTTSGIRNNSAWNRRFWNKITIFKRNECLGLSQGGCHYSGISSVNECD